MKIKVNYNFLLLVFFAFAFAWIFGGKLPYSVLFTLIVVFLHSALSIREIYKNLSITVRCNRESVYVGEAFEREFLLVNKGEVNILNMELIVPKGGRDGEERCIPLVINSDKSKSIVENVKYLYRGVYNLADVKVRISDYFGIITITKEADEEFEISIYPRIHEVYDVLNTKSQYFDADEVEKKGFEDRNFTKDIKKYSQGDDIKRIHWKASAKYNELMVKNYERVVGDKAVLFMDMNESNMGNVEKEEEAVECCISIINEFLKKDISHKVFLNDSNQKYFEVKSKREYFEIFEYFKNNVSDGKVELEKNIYANVNKLSRGCWIGIICTQINRKMLEYVINLSEQGFRISIIHNEDDDENLNGENGYSFNKININRLMGVDLVD